MSSFADFTTKLQDTLQLAVKLGEEVKTLVISTNEMEHYFNSTNTTGREWETFTTISKKVTNLSSEAVQLAERASDEIHIAFIGTINAGKTTMINRLLQADVLPVMNGETTFCNVAISGTAEKQMIAIERKSGEILPADSLKELLNVLKAKPEREKFGIEPNSVIDVKSPKEGCRALVENVVLYDTPGIGHRKETDDAVVDLCKKVDVIVAVMDTHSPSLRIILDVVKEVRCNFTYGVFTRWDSFKEDSSDTDVEERKKDYTTDFRNAVPKRGEVFFVDSISVKNEKDSDGSKGFGDFEKQLEEASKGALKLNTLTFQLQKILSEAKSVSNELIDVIETRKNKLIGNITRKLESVHDYKKTYDKNFKSMEKAVKKIMDEETKSVEDGSFNKYIESEMNKKGLREETLENCRKRLNDEIKQKVESNPQVKKTSLAISTSFKEMEPELSANVSVGTSPWEEDDFGLDKDFTFKDNNLHSYLTKPSWTFKGIGYGTLTSAGSVAWYGLIPWAAGLALALTAVGSAANHRWPSTDPCGCIKYFWPASEEEIKAVQEFFKTKTVKLQQKKLVSLMEEIHELRNKADNKVEDKMKTLEEEIENLKTGENVLNRQASKIVDLIKSFEELELKLKEL